MAAKGSPVSLFFPVLCWGIALALLSGCGGFLPAPEEEPEGNSSSRQFWAYNWVTKRYYPCDANLLAEGSHCIVYGEKSGKVTGGGSLNTAIGQRIAGEFDRKIYPLITGSFGDFLDVDGNGKIILLLLDIQDGYSAANSASGYIAGYFDGYDMEQKSQFSYSNEADMLYIDTWPTDPSSSGSYVTMAHELQHLINYSTHRGAGSGEMDLWIDEGLSSAAEYLYGGPQQSRINWYNNAENKSIHYGNNFFVWDGYWEADDQPGRGIPTDSLTNYATVYLFFQWLRIHAAGSTDIYRDITGSPYTDLRAVTGAASRRINSGLSDWAALLTTWYAANRLNSAAGLYGYKGLDGIKLNPLSVSSAGHEIALAPGEGVYSPLPALTSPSSGGAHIGYTGIDTGEKTLGTDFPYAGDMLLLTYNGNTDNSQGRESGYVGYAADLQYRLDQAAGMASAARSSLSTQTPAPEWYQWDGARYFLDKRNRENGR